MRNNLDVSSLILQLYSVILLLQDYNNRDLMQELQKQDSEYLENDLNKFLNSRGYKRDEFDLIFDLYRDCDDNEEDDERED